MIKVEGQITPAGGGITSVCLFLCLAGADAERCVQGAETDRAGKQENNAQNQEDNPQRAGYDIGEIQYGKQNCQSDPDDPVYRAHVLFHKI
jgi:hypothetical protein